MRQGKGFNAPRFSASGQCRERHVACGVGVAGDVEPEQRRREQKGCKLVGQERQAVRLGKASIDTQRKAMGGPSAMPFPSASARGHGGRRGHIKVVGMEPGSDAPR